MTLTPLIPDNDVCPLCGKNNSCGMSGVSTSNSTSQQNCWCFDSKLRFPKVLLEKIPKDKKGKACICRACAIKAQATDEASCLDAGIQFFEPK